MQPLPWESLFVIFTNRLIDNVGFVPRDNDANEGCGALLVGFLIVGIKLDMEVGIRIKDVAI